ncbi:hypothetical protein [Rhizobium sp. NFR03]|uniref:hypothetical protein n=1 Tax=Rhizobium sp. NFR03 TaxID=1566263 RepID=UPI000B851276|nr:hypothetical protein [Rhizobium sp. NFR03]
MSKTVLPSVNERLEWRKANPISHGDFKGLAGDKVVARIYLAVSDISLNENWHWELTAHHKGLSADDVAGQAPSHIAAADAAEQAYARILLCTPVERENSDSGNAPSETDRLAEALEHGGDA